MFFFVRAVDAHGDFSSFMAKTEQFNQTNSQRPASDLRQNASLSKKRRRSSFGSRKKLLDSNQQLSLTKQTAIQLTNQPGDQFA